MATKKKKTTKPSTKPKKKVPAKKVKKPAKKKAVKAAKNPHEGKRYFMLEFGGNGGEFILGNTTEEFVEYWLDEENRDYSLSDHIMAMHEGAMSYSDDMLDEEEADEVTLDVPEGFDEESPEVNPGRKYSEYWELDDIEHETAVSADYSSYTVVEVDLHPKAVYSDGALEWDEKERRKRNFDWSQKIFTEKGESKDYYSENVKRVYTTEMFVHDTKKGLVDPIPVVMLYDAQKGTFGRIIVETNGEDFDPKKLVYGVNENNMTTYIDQYFYDKKSINVDYDNLSTWGKGFHACVGYMPKGEIEYNYEELLSEGWKDLEDNE